MRYRLSAVNDPAKNFAYKGALVEDTVIKWPKYCVDVSGVDVQTGKLDVRRSVYNFMEDTSRAIREMEAHIINGRHMFLSGYSDLFKALHFAEGYQKYRWNGNNSGLPSVPECFADEPLKMRENRD